MAYGLERHRAFLRLNGCYNDVTAPLNILSSVLDAKAKTYEAAEAEKQQLQAKVDRLSQQLEEERASSSHRLAMVVHDYDDKLAQLTAQLHGAAVQYTLAAAQQHQMRADITAELAAEHLAEISQLRSQLDSVSNSKEEQLTSLRADNEAAVEKVAGLEEALAEGQRALDEIALSLQLALQQADGLELERDRAQAAERATEAERASLAAQLNNGQRALDVAAVILHSVVGGAAQAAAKEADAERERLFSELAIVREWFEVCQQEWRSTQEELLAAGDLIRWMRTKLQQANKQRDEAMEEMLWGECQAAPLVEAVEIELLAEHARYKALEEKSLENQYLAHLYKSYVLQLKADVVQHQAKAAGLQQQLTAVQQQYQQCQQQQQRRYFLQPASAKEDIASLQQERNYWKQEVEQRQKQNTEYRQLQHVQTVADKATISKLKQEVESLMQQLNAVREGRGAAASQQGAGGYGMEDARRRGNADARRTGSAAGKQWGGGNYY